MEDRLRKFARLVDAGSFTAAAQELHLSQPALSIAIHKLERELKAELIVRHSRHLELTDAGRVAYEAAHEVQAVASNLNARLVALAGTRPSLSLGMIDSVASIVFSSVTNIDVMERLASVSIVVNNSRYLRRAIERGDLDVAFVTELDRQPGPEVVAEPLVLVCHAARAVPMRAELQAGRLSQFISYDPKSTTRRLIDREMERRHIRPTPRFFSSSPDIIYTLTCQQKGSAVLPYWLVHDALTRHELVLLGAPQPVIIYRTLTSLVRTHQLPGVPYQKLVEHIQELVDVYAKGAERSIR